jgi:hypothetical protein
VRMPNLGLSESDAGDVLAYLELLTYRLSGTQSGGQDTSAPAQQHQHHHHH